MKVEYLKQFSKDILRINENSQKNALLDVIVSLKNAENLSEIPNVKKLKGHPFAYRIRVGKYRLGFYFDSQIISLARFVKREDIYKLFP